MLTEEQLSEIKGIYPDYKNKELADMYNVELHHIRGLAVRYGLTKNDGNYKKMLIFANSLNPNKQYKRIVPAFNDYGITKFLDMFKSNKLKQTT